MKLTVLAARVLKNYIHFHDRGWSVSHVLPLYGRNWLFMALLGLIASGMFWPFSCWGSGLVAGFIAGAILRDIGHMRFSSLVWPILDEITDWQRVSELVETLENRAP